MRISKPIFLAGSSAPSCNYWQVGGVSKGAFSSSVTFSFLFLMIASWPPRVILLELKKDTLAFETHLCELSCRSRRALLLVPREPRPERGLSRGAVAGIAQSTSGSFLG